MNIVVTDANILIDLCELDILEEFFSLPYNMSVVGAVWDELSDEQQQMYANYLDDGRFSLVPQEDINLITINEIKESRQQLSIPDCSSLVYAEEVEGILLTSDKNLRTTARVRGVEFRGHLWVLDEMVNSHTMSPDVAISKLSDLRTSVNTKLGLPANECETKIRLWSNM